MPVPATQRYEMACAADPAVGLLLAKSVAGTDSRAPDRGVLEAAPSAGRAFTPALPGGHHFDLVEACSSESVSKKWCYTPEYAQSPYAWDGHPRGMKWRVPLLVDLEVRLVAYRAYLRDHGLSSWSRGLLGAASSAGVSKPTVAPCACTRPGAPTGTRKPPVYSIPLKKANPDIP